MRIFLLSLIALTLQAQQKLQFEVASIRPLQSSEGAFHYNVLPNRLDVKDINLRFLLQDAFEIPDFQLTGPDFMQERHFDIMATTAKPVSRTEMRELLRNLLIERFHLATHWDTKAESVDHLEVLPGGPKMEHLEAGYASPNSPTGGNGTLRFTGPMSMPQLAQSLTRYGHKPVIDQTHLEGFFKINLLFASGSLSANDAPAPALADALKEQLGLKLTSVKEPIKILVVDHIDETPTEN